MRVTVVATAVGGIPEIIERESPAPRPGTRRRDHLGSALAERVNALLDNPIRPRRWVRLTRAGGHISRGSQSPSERPTVRLTRLIGL